MRNQSPSCFGPNLFRYFMIFFKVAVSPGISLSAQNVKMDYQKQNNEKFKHGVKGGVNILKNIIKNILKNIFIEYRLELLIPPYNTMLKLLIILFVIKLYARIEIFITQSFS